MSMDLKTRLEQLREENQKRIKETTDLDALNQIRVNLLGKKSPITEVLRGLKNLDQDERPKVGAFANQIKADLQANLQTRREALEQAAIDAKLESETIDVTLPGDQMLEGTPHILDQIMDDIEELFIGHGYQVVDGTEVEGDH